jgi:hypothetical protein
LDGVYTFTYDNQRTIHLTRLTQITAEKKRHDARNTPK